MTCVGVRYVLQRGTGWPAGPTLPAIFKALLLCPTVTMARRETSFAVYQLCVGLAEAPVTPKPALYFEEMLLAQLKDIADPHGGCPLCAPLRNRHPLETHRRFRW